MTKHQKQSALTARAWVVAALETDEVDMIVNQLVRARGSLKGVQGLGSQRGLLDDAIDAFRLVQGRIGPVSWTDPTFRHARLGLHTIAERLAVVAGASVGIWR